MSTLLANQQCEACANSAKPMNPADIDKLIPQLPDWQCITVDGVLQLERVYHFDNYRTALAFTNAVAALAESHNHHPVIELQWDKVTVNWWTHTVNGLHRNDFILAAKCDQLYESE